MSDLTLIIGTQTFSSWSLRPWIALCMTGAKFKVEKIALRKPDTKAKILERSPSGHVPLLIDGSLKVWDSLAILEYLAERFPAAGLWPKDAAARAEARSLAAEMHAGFAALRNDFTMDLRLSTRQRALGAVANDIARIAEIWRDCRKRHGGGGEFLFGHFTNVDAMFAPVVTRFRTYNVPLDAVCAAYRDTMLALPAMRRWYAEAAAEW
ncbi:MAG TPA: glutathione S-transferase family protein [Candidatus Cybelea sp.]|nr:glutathione S-transferase family protein [Candidatus Cybelea sp.]